MNDLARAAAAVMADRRSRGGPAAGVPRSASVTGTTGTVTPLFLNDNQHQRPAWVEHGHMVMFYTGRKSGLTKALANIRNVRLP
jgi:hypothetical protein